MKLTQFAKTIIFCISIFLSTNSLFAQETKFYPMGEAYHDIRVSPNKQYIAGTVFISSMPNNTMDIHIVDAKTGELVSIINQRNSINGFLFDIGPEHYDLTQHFAFSDDSRYLYTFSFDNGTNTGHLGKWDISSGVEINSYPVASLFFGNVLHFEVHDDIAVFMDGLSPNELQIVPLGSLDKKKVIDTGLIGGFTVLSDERKIVCFRENYSISIYNYNGDELSNIKLTKALPGFDGNEYFPAKLYSFVKNDKYLYMQGLSNIHDDYNAILRIEIDNPSNLKIFKNHSIAFGIKAFDINETGDKILIPVGRPAGNNKYAAIAEYDVNFEHKKEYQVPKGTTFITSCFYASDKIVGHEANSCFFYGEENNSYLACFPVDHVSSMYVTNDNKYMIGAEINGDRYPNYNEPIKTIYFVYDTDLQKTLSKKSVYETTIYNRKSSYHCAKQSLFVPVQNRIAEYQIPGFDYIQSYEGHTGDVTSVSLSLDSTKLISASLDSTVIVWNLQTKKQVYHKKLDKAIQNALFIDDNDILYFVTADNPDVKGYIQGYILDIKDGTIEETSIVYSSYRKSEYDYKRRTDRLNYMADIGKIYYSFYDHNGLENNYYLSYDVETNRLDTVTKYPAANLSSNMVFATNHNDFLLSTWSQDDLALYDVQKDSVYKFYAEDKYPEYIFPKCVPKFSRFPKCKNLAIAYCPKVDNVYYATDLGAMGIMNLTPLTSIEDDIQKDNSQAVIYPNPISNGTLSIDLDNPEEILSVQMFNYMGELLASFPELRNTYSKILQLQIGNYPSGAYVIRISCKDKVISKNIIVK